MNLLREDHFSVYHRLVEAISAKNKSKKRSEK